MSKPARLLGEAPGRMVCRCAPGESFGRPIVLTPPAREAISQAIRVERQKDKGITEQENIAHLHGVLRGLQLDQDWLEITDATGNRIRVHGAGETVDDAVGPMVNRRVIVDVIQRSTGAYMFRDIQPEE